MAETAIRLMTPEGVPLAIRASDIGSRIGAYLLDLLFIGLAMLLLLVPIILGARYIPGFDMEWALVAFMLTNFALTNGYFILMEMGPRSATFGKRRMKLRVVAADGARLTADAVIARNLMRNLEFSLPLGMAGVGEGGGGALALLGLLWSGVFLAFPLFSRNHRRVGDLLAGTLVVEVPRHKLEALPAAIDGGWDFTDAQLDIYGALELAKLDEVLAGEDPGVIASVAEAIRARTGIAARGGDAPFLHAYRLALRERLQRDLLFGRLKPRRGEKAPRV